MSIISLNSISFQYDSSSEPVFTGLSLAIDTQWKTGLVGRNGRGKSTLLSLINGDHDPVSGTIDRPVPSTLFPLPIDDPAQPAFALIKEWIAPYKRWEVEMETLLHDRSDAALLRYGDILEQYERHHGYTIDAMIEHECSELGLAPATLQQSFASLSGGEQTRSMIAALFLKQETFALLDEPTNHLDMNGRAALGDYLSRKEGFIVVSHDRTFLDRCCDHTISLNRSGIRIFPGNYSAWNAQSMLEEDTERARNNNLAKEIESLELVARQRRTWSDWTEKEKTKAADSGFVSHKAAKMMKRALASERRIEKNIEEKKTLLMNVETAAKLTMDEAHGAPEVLLSVENIGVAYDGRSVLTGLSFTLRRGQRIALIGDNGSGKTSLMRMLRGEIQPASGLFRIPGFVSVASGYQHPLWAEGMLRDHVRSSGIGETKFRTIMGAFGIRGDIFDRPLETFSRGELKKVDLCRSFLKPNHLLLWDEPVNYIDIHSREQIEDVILRDMPTMLFTEHDRRFVDRIATDVIVMPKRS